MTQPTLQQIFGANATQTSTYVQISKSDLAAFGLVASATNTAESLKVAMDLLAMSYLTAANQTSNPDIQITMADGFDSFVTRNNQTYIQRQITNSYQEPFTASALNPANY